jgi:spermidine synthase
MLPLVFAGPVAVMYLIAQAVAQVFATFEPLVAYRLDIVGSLLGIAGFALLSWMRLPPVVWGAVAAVGILIAGGSRLRGRDRLLMAGLVVVLGAQSVAPGSLWSPYYRVDVEESGDVTRVWVNGIPHQEATTVAMRREAEPVYFSPYELVDTTSLERVLIVGAGTGTDVAIAIAHGAGRIDAVEIDPVLYEIGRSRHPDRPYDDPRVNVVIDDGRAFMERATERYDLILFALPDSLTLVSGQSSLRLESFLFTEEAIARAADLLTSDGVFAMYNYYREDWLIGRLARTLQQSTGGVPCVVAPSGAGGLAMLASGSGVEARCETSAAAFLVDAPSPVSDDHPFLYVRDRGIPTIYLVALGSILAISALAVRATGTRMRAFRPHADLFVMGTAFLLLETKSVVQFALWFGTTWAVNALVFAGVLLSVLAAIELARARRLPPLPILYAVLLASVAASWLVPAGALLALPGPARFVAAVLLTFTPIFIANLVFARRFASTSHSTAAFGANLLGAMVGGVLEYTSLILGYRALAVLVAVLYGGAFMVWRRSGHRSVNVVG